MTSVHPASITVKHALFSSLDTCVGIKSVHPASIAVKHALFSSKIRINIDISPSDFNCNETRVIFIEEFVCKNKRSSSSFDCSETRVIFIESYVFKRD